jgi:hypothetical protein
MKNLAFLVIALVFFGCDQITEPYDENFVIEGEKVILLEDFTGHTCSNCPAASITAKSLLDVYGDNLVVVATHNTQFADPKGNLSADYRTETGEELDNIFSIQEAGLPKGMINRVEYENTLLMNHTAWGSAVAEALKAPATHNIELIATFDERTREVVLNAEIEFLNFGTNSTQLVVYVLEDSIVSPQKNETEFVVDYVHNHMLRMNVSAGGTFGDKVTNVEVGPGTKINKTYTFTLPEEYRENHIDLVAYVHDNSTKEVFQAQKLHLIKE